jgi:hypothetical protein|tara:strand:+ start:753 stop:1082 length:330 start_codon:yes stop_codon:yes gene_type:complete
MNTDEYDGHTPGPWVYNRLNSKGQYNLIAPDDWAIDMMAYDCITAEDKGMKEQDMSLIAAAPDLLAEVKRLREAFITAVRHLDVESRNKMFNDMDELDDLHTMWLFRSE